MKSETKMWKKIVCALQILTSSIFIVAIVLAAIALCSPGGEGSGVGGTARAIIEFMEIQRPIRMDVVCNETVPPNIMCIEDTVAYCPLSSVLYHCVNGEWVMFEANNGEPGPPGPTGATGSTGALGIVYVPVVDFVYDTGAMTTLISLNGSNGNPLYVYQAVTVTRGATTYYSVETPQTSLPPYGTFGEEATFVGFQIQDGDIIRHTYYTGPNAMVDMIYGQTEYVYGKLCIQRIGYEPDPICWDENTTNYCSYPVIIGGLYGYEANDLDEVIYTIQTNYSSSLELDPFTGCFFTLTENTMRKRMTFPEVRGDSISNFMIFTVQTTSSNQVFELDFQYFEVSVLITCGNNRIDVNWGDGGILIEKDTSLTKNHTYVTPGVYRVTLAGQARCFTRNRQTVRSIRNVEQFGVFIRNHLDFSLERESNLLTFSATDAPNVELQSIDRFLYSLIINTSTPLVDTTAWTLPSLRFMRDSFRGVAVAPLPSLSSSVVIENANFAFNAARLLTSPFPVITLSGNAVNVFANAVFTVDFSPENWVITANSVTNIFQGATFVGNVNMTQINWSGVTSAVDAFRDMTAQADWVGPGAFPALQTANSMFYNAEWMGSADLRSFGSVPLVDASFMFQLATVVGPDMYLNTPNLNAAGTLTAARSMFQSIQFVNCTNMFVGPWTYSIVNAQEIFRLAVCADNEMVAPTNWTSCTNWQQAFEGVVNLRVDAPFFTPVASDLESTFFNTVFKGDPQTGLWSFPMATIATSFLHGARLLEANSFEVTNWDFGRVTTMSSAFRSIRLPLAIANTIVDLTPLNMGFCVSFANTFADFDRDRLDADAVRVNVTGWDMRNMTSTNSMFSGIVKIVELIGTATWDTPKWNSAFAMFFAAATNLLKRGGATSIDMSQWDTSSLVNTGAFSAGDLAVNQLFVGQNLSGWDVGSLTITERMFNLANVSGLIGLDLWRPYMLQDVRDMFSGTRNIQSSMVENWLMPSLTVADRFCGSGTGSFDMTNWRPTMITSAQIAFTCSGTTDTSQWALANPVNLSSMFANHGGQLNITLWNVASVTSVGNIFNNNPISTANYDTFLIKFATESTRTNQNPGTITTKYSPAASSARSTLIGRGWTLNDGGPL